MGVCLLLSGCGKPAPVWQDYRATEWGFHASFPEAPQAASGGPAKPRDVDSSFEARCIATAVPGNYVVAAFHSSEEREPLLTRLQDYYGGGDATPGPTGKLGEQPWQEWKYVRGNEARRARFLVREQRGYVWSVSYTLDRMPTEADIQKFFDSFGLDDG